MRALSFLRAFLFGFFRKDHLQKLPLHVTFRRVTQKVMHGFKRQRRCVLLADIDPSQTLNAGKLIMMGIGLLLVAIASAIYDTDQDGPGPSGLGGPDVFG